MAYGTHVYPDSVHTEGITSITKEDVGYADAWGGVIKLIGEVKKLENGRVHIQVAPMFISRESQLANVDDVFNGILVRGDATGDVVFYGKGAGKLPTASAVVADVIDCVRHLRSDRKILFWEDSKPDYVQPWEDTPQDLFVRVSGEGDSDSLFDLVQQVFPEAVRLIRRDEEQGETGFTLSEVTENQLKAKIPALEERGLKLENRITIADF
ncbi:homoserine dehydrogenase [Clostridium sp. CAG:1013]|nr:homoserine dehydrogenase [Clostridium sp. CAG:1013]